MHRGECHAGQRQVKPSGAAARSREPRNKMLPRADGRIASARILIGDAVPVIASSTPPLRESRVIASEEQQSPPVDRTSPTGDRFASLATTQGLGSRTPATGDSPAAYAALCLGSFVSDSLDRLCYDQHMPAETLLQRAEHVAGHRGKPRPQFVFVPDVFLDDVRKDVILANG